MFVRFKSGPRTYRVSTDVIALIEEMPGGYQVTLKVPSRAAPGSRPLGGQLSAIELTGDEARPLIDYIDRIARVL